MPQWCVNAIHDESQWPNLRHLKAVVDYPTFMPDGSIPKANDYHADSGMFVNIPDSLSIRVADNPTREDIADSVRQSRSLTCDFPFKAPADFSAWLARLLTPLAWFSFDGPAPLFLVDANKRGTGKCNLCELASIILTGRNMPSMQYTNDLE